MFYYLLYNSSFTFIVENRLFSTILYGSILYILTHAVLNYCDVSILTIINNYYWTLLTLDIISFTYAIYNSFINHSGDEHNNNDNDNNNNNNNNNINVSFNLLKNKINTLFDRKNDLTITHIPNNNNSNNNNYNSNNHNSNNSNNRKNKNEVQEQFTTIENNSNHLNSNNYVDIHRSKNKDPLDDLDFTDLEHLSSPSNDLNSTAQFSTPINHLKKNNIPMNTAPINTNPTTSTSSTPISLIRNNVKIQDLSFTNTNVHLNNNDNCNESTAGSDVGSVMDLADFENSF